MPQLLMPPAALPMSAQTARYRAVLQWLGDTPGLSNLFTDAQGNPSALPWNEYTDVTPPAMGGASVATICEFSRSAQYNGPCGAGATYLATLRITVAMGNILSARELLSDIVGIVEDRLFSSPVDFPAISYGGATHFERFNWGVSPRAPGWTYTKDIKGNESGGPGGKAIALGIFTFEGGAV